MKSQGKRNVSIEIASLTLKCIAKIKGKKDLFIKATCKRTCAKATLP